MARLAQTKCCIICGHEVFRPRPMGQDIPALTWRQRYRIVYQDLQHSTRLSGLASHRDSRGHSWYAPWDYDDTREYSGIANLPERESIRVMDCHSSSENHLRYGFPAHANCWILLQKVYSPTPVPYDMLFNVCKSLEGPEPDRILDWGHDYGGALLVTYGDRVEGRNVDDIRDTPGFFHHDPFSSDEIEGLLRRSSETPPSGAEVSLETSVLKDSLASLPSDVRFLIANLLPTDDLHALRLASRAFYFIFHEQSYWALRFVPGGERDWLFEATGIAKVQKVDWRALYKTTSHFEWLPPSLRNRSRIWNFAKLIKDATPSSPITSVTRPSIFGLDCEFDVWAEVTSSQLDTTRSSEDRPKVELPRQKFQLPGPLEEIKAYFIRLGSAEFISGITFFMTSNRSRHIGYKSGSVRRLKLREDPIGFNLQLEYLGILSIQAVYSNGDISEWLGDGLCMPTTRRLVLHDKITAVEGVFDVCTSLLTSVEQSLPMTFLGLQTDKTVVFKTSTKDNGRRRRNEQEKIICFSLRNLVPRNARHHSKFKREVCSASL
ncbi:unnamed protein product [Clonostachys rhizophaga]|uniref:F-box domain-containing protein n=1 Tax=Clonostachys rhizophaga TaxID=160324 RepID=A0A9N9YT90_9HYPO|nr:unnamed protein product [Clonostachys rhizophaga]